jgi:hypothetical protein
MIVPSRRLGVCLIALGRSSRKGGQGRSQPGGLGRKQQASLEITAAAKQHAVVARSFCEPAKRQPAGKRSPATIYGGLRLAGTLVLLHRCCRALILPFLIAAAAGGTEQNGYDKFTNHAKDQLSLAHIGS